MTMQLLDIAAAVLIYLFVDIYPLVNSAYSIVRTASFWLLWIVQSALAIVAYGALEKTAGTKIESAVGPQFAHLAAIVLAVLGSLTVLQSFSLKIADHKFLDIQKPLENFRSKVLQDISKKFADNERLKTMRIADKLFRKYANNVQGLREEYAHVMSFVEPNTNAIGQLLAEIEDEAKIANLSFDKLLARKISSVDIGRARELVG